MIRFFFYFFSLLIISTQAQARYYSPSHTFISTGDASLTIKDMDKFLKTFHYLQAYSGELYEYNYARYTFPYTCSVTDLSGYPRYTEYEEGSYVKYMVNGHYAYDITVGDGDMYPDQITITCFGHIKGKDFTEEEARSTFLGIGSIGFYTR